MSFQNNGCKDCTEEKICPRCYLGMVEFEFDSARRKIMIIQEEIGNYLAAITFWDLVCSEAMLKVEYFKGKLKEQANANNR